MGPITPLVDLKAQLGGKASRGGGGLGEEDVRGSTFRVLIGTKKREKKKEKKTYYQSQKIKIKN